jgi:hypothetical protein
LRAVDFLRRAGFFAAFFAGFRAAFFFGIWVTSSLRQMTSPQNMNVCSVLRRISLTLATTCAHVKTFQETFFRVYA